MNDTITAPEETKNTLDNANIRPDGFAVADAALKNGEVKAETATDIFSPENDSDEPEGEEDDEETPPTPTQEEFNAGIVAAVKGPALQKSDPEVEGRIKLTIETHGKVYSCMTDDIADAIEQLGLKTTNTRTLVRAECDGKVYEQVFFVAYARRLFTQKMARTLLEKRIKMKLNV